MKDSKRNGPDTSATAQRTSGAMSTDTAKEISGMIRRFYAAAQEAAHQGEPVAYSMMGSVPPELFVASGIRVVYPEHYGTVCGAKHCNMAFLERAEQHGFAPYTCSYARNWLGYSSRMQDLGDVPPEAPWGGLPKPSLLLGRSSCEAGYKGFQSFHRYLEAPLFVYDRKMHLPASLDFDDKELIQRYVEFEKGQIRSLVAFLEKHSGRKIRWDEVSEAIVRHHEARRLWHGIYQLRKAVPSPISSRDIAACIFPLFYLMGTQEALDFYRKLHQEVKHRVEHGIGVISNEKYRLLWGGIAQWHNLGFFNALESRGGVFVVEDIYYNDPLIEVDPSDPVQAIAERAVADAVNRGRRARLFGGVGDRRAGLILELVRDFHVDGAVLHLIASCRPIAVGWTHVGNMLREHLNTPVLALESDISDTRAYSEAQTMAQLDAFVDAIESHRAKR